MLSTSHKRVLGCGLVVGPEDGGLDLTKAGVCQANTVKRGKVEGFGGTGKGSVTVMDYGEGAYGIF